MADHLSLRGQSSESNRDKLQELESPWVVSRMPIDSPAVAVLVPQLEPVRPTAVQRTFTSPFDPSVAKMLAVHGLVLKVADDGAIPMS
jgi:hypothetical protein